MQTSINGNEISWVKRALAADIGLARNAYVCMYVCSVGVEKRNQKQTA
jgi:hypothetical protein